jgi:5'-nucleotidase
VSLIKKGKQMIPILNRIGIACACVGNHDFDFGVECLDKLIAETNFPWLMSNVLDGETKESLASTRIKHVLTINDIKV